MVFPLADAPTRVAATLLGRQVCACASVCVHVRVCTEVPTLARLE